MAWTTENRPLPEVTSVWTGLRQYYWGRAVGSILAAYTLVYLTEWLDIRQVGTGNSGPLSAFHQTGVVGGLAVLAIGAGKGALAVLAIDWARVPYWVLYLSAPLLMDRPNWTVLLGFRDGKGAASIFGISSAVQPIPTLTTLVLVVLLVVMIRNLMRNAAFGFVLINIMLVATRQGAEQIALCASLIAIVNHTYVFSIREQIGESIKTCQ